jgi:DNA mismatch repair protein MutL
MGKISSRIRILDSWTITKIKAGQIITNYKDIVKELVENSLDAKSINIIIYLNFDKQEISIIDDGQGMNYEDLNLCIKNHATSKFISLDCIQYLGFRGEGLQVINDCCDVTIISKQKNDIGYKLQQVLNSFVVKPEAANNGTNVLVQNIFHKTPGKIKFLSLRKDFFNSVFFIQQLALSHPHIKFHIYKNNKYYLYLHGDNYDDLIFQIFKITQTNKINISHEQFVLNIYLNENIKEKKGRILFFVNKRPVQDFGILSTLKRMLQNYTGEGNINFLLIFLTIDNHYVDCNVTANKFQVNISILDKIINSIEEFFRKKTLIKNNNMLQENPQFLEQANLISWFPYHNKYIIANFNDVVYFIDQHALSERLLLQKLENTEYNMQILLQQIAINLTEEELLILQDETKLMRLKQLKFEYQLIGNYLLLYAIPDFLPIHHLEYIIRDFILEDNFHIFLHKLSDISCKYAMKAGYKINESEVKEFLRIINTNNNCKFCNHGRNTYITFNENNLDKLFGRKI